MGHVAHGLLIFEYVFLVQPHTQVPVNGARYNHGRHEKHVVDTVENMGATTTAHCHNRSPDLPPESPTISQRDHSCPIKQRLHFSIDVGKIGRRAENKDSNKPFTVQVAYSEYCQKTSEGSPTKFWNEKPKTMLTKTADSQALRKAFNIHGAYCPEELGAGFETESGEIITQTVDAEFSRVEPDKTRLSIVVKPPPEEPPPPANPPTVINDAETEWPDPPAPVTQNEASGVPDEIISMLEANQIPYELDLENGVISATSYKYKDLLKANSFRWSASKKSWELFFEPDPF